MLALADATASSVLQFLTQAERGLTASAAELGESAALRILTIW